MLTVNRPALSRALLPIRRVVEKRNTLPILGAAKVTFAHDIMRLVGTDRDIRVETILPLESFEAGAVGDLGVWPVDALHALTVAPDETLKIERVNGSLRVDAGAAKYELKGAMASEDFPAFPMTEPAFEADMDAAALDAILSVKAAMSTEETRYYLNGIYLFEKDGGGTQVCATDGHRLFVAPVPMHGTGDIGGGDKQVVGRGVILPKKLIRVLDELRPTLTFPVSFRVTACNWEEREAGGRKVTTGHAPGVSIVWSGTAIHAKTINGSFPDVFRAIPERTDRAGVVPVGMLRGALDALGAFRGKTRPMIAVALAETGATLIAKDYDGSEVGVSIPCTGWTDDPVNFGVNHGYFAQVAAFMASACGALRIQVDDAGSPIRFDIAEDRQSPAPFAVLMPMRV